MLCCLLAGFLAVAGAKGHRQRGSSARARVPGQQIPRWRAARIIGFGWCCGVLAFEVVAALAAGTGGLNTTRPELLLGAASAVTAVGVLFAVSGGTPRCRRGWALFALSTSAGSALAELADLHLLALHRGPDLVSSAALHGLAVVPGIIAGRLLIQLGHQEDVPELLPAGRSRRPAPVATRH